MHRAFTAVAHAGCPHAAHPALCSTPRCCASTPFSNLTDPTISRDGWPPCSLPLERRHRRSRPTGHGAATHTPYVGGDPINYLKFARAMRNFYAAHVREPMFPAVTRIGLMLTGDEDVGISLTSIVFGLLTLVATYALGALVASPMVGLAAAAMLGIDQSAVYWAIGGWRDELFAFFAISCTWAWMRFSAPPDTRECRPRRRAQRRRVPDENHDDCAHRPGRRLAARRRRGPNIPAGVTRSPSAS